MKKQDFSYELPDELIAQTPLDGRTTSRMLVYRTDQPMTYQHHSFSDIGQFLSEGDLLVMNDTRVVAARLYGCKSSGGKIELLIERVINEWQFACQLKASKAPKAGSLFFIDDKVPVTVTGRRGELFVCELSEDISVFDLIKHHGHVPLPPYIERAVTADDLERYQTVFAKNEGAVAAPTAGLHFDQPLLDSLQQSGVLLAYLTLHVGAGTFQPIRVDNVSEHKMHSEWLQCDQRLVDKINQTKANGGRVIAVGTTVVRALETAALFGKLAPYEGETDIFLYPGKPFNVVDGMVTNFHLPESSLMMLVAAFIGIEAVTALYQEAVDKRYRFFSYGDSSLLLRSGGC